MMGRTVELPVGTVPLPAGVSRGMGSEQ
jgi:hypothetical protein